MDEPEIHETTKQAEHRHWRFTILHAFALVILFVVLQFWIYLVIQRVTGLKVDDLRWYHLIILTGIPGAITLAAGAYMNDFHLESLLFDHFPGVAGVFFTVLAVTGVAILSSEVINLLRLYIQLPINVTLVDQLMKEDLIGVFLTAMVVSPIIEELLFRGVILDGLQKYYTVSTAVVASSILFGLVHFDVFTSIYTFLLALFLAWLRISSGSILLCVIAHAANNAFPFLLVRVFKVQTEGIVNTSSKAVVFQPLWFDALGLVLFVVGVAALKLIDDRDPKTGPSGQVE